MDSEAETAVKVEQQTPDKTSRLTVNTRGRKRETLMDGSLARKVPKATCKHQLFCPILLAELAGTKQSHSGKQTDGNPYATVVAHKKQNRAKKEEPSAFVKEGGTVEVGGAVRYLPNGDEQQVSGRLVQVMKANGKAKIRFWAVVIPDGAVSLDKLVVLPLSKIIDGEPMVEVLAPTRRIREPMSREELASQPSPLAPRSWCNRC